MSTSFTISNITMATPTFSKRDISENILFGNPHIPVKRKIGFICWFEFACKTTLNSVNEVLNLEVLCLKPIG